MGSRRGCEIDRVFQYQLEQADSQVITPLFMEIKEISSGADADCGSDLLNKIQSTILASKTLISEQIANIETALEENGVSRIASSYLEAIKSEVVGSIGMESFANLTLQDVNKLVTFLCHDFNAIDESSFQLDKVHRLKDKINFLSVTLADELGCSKEEMQKVLSEQLNKLILETQGQFINSHKSRSALFASNVAPQSVETTDNLLNARATLAF